MEIANDKVYKGP